METTDTLTETCTWRNATMEVIKLMETWQRDKDLVIMDKDTATCQVLAAIEKGIGNG